VESSANIQDEVLLNRPPTPPKPKTILPPIELEPFKKYSNFQVFKDENIERQLAEERKQEFDNFRYIREQILRIREEERKNTITYKSKQIEECETLQQKLDEARKKVYEPREQFRQAYLDAERRRLDEIHAKEQLILLSSKPDVSKNKKGSAGKAKKK